MIPASENTETLAVSGKVEYFSASFGHRHLIDNALLFSEAPAILVREVRVGMML